MPTVRLALQSKEEFAARFLYEMFHMNHHPLVCGSITSWGQLTAMDRAFWETSAVELLEGLKK